MSKTQPTQKLFFWYLSHLPTPHFTFLWASYFLPYASPQNLIII